MNRYDHPGLRPAWYGQLGRHQLLFFEANTGTNPGGTGAPSDLQALLARHNNDAMALVASLYAENTALRGRVPADGAVVLSAADAATWNNYRELGAAADIQTRLTAAETASSELARLTREKLLGEVAAIGNGSATYNPTVLARLAGDTQFAIRGDGDKRHVVVTDGDSEIALAEYEKQHWAAFQASLHQAPPQATGTAFVQQPSGSGAPTNPAEDAFKRFQAARDNTHNPLLPKSPNAVS